MQVKPSMHPSAGSPLEEGAPSPSPTESQPVEASLDVASADSPEPTSAATPASFSSLVEEVVTAEYGALAPAHLKAITDWLQNDPRIAELQKLSQARNEPKSEE